MINVALANLKMLLLLTGTICLKFLGMLCASLNFGEINSKNILFIFFIGMMFLPDLGILISKDFRQWIKSGIEDSDGQFNSDDLANLFKHFSTLWCIRLYVLFGLLEAFYHLQVRDIYVLGSLAGAFGIETINFFTKKK